jgi:CRP-like cAMP-binding protein
MTSKVELKALTLLRSVKLTGDMETEHLRKLAAMAKEVEFSEGEIIYRRGDRGQALYLIQAGEVIIETDVPGQDPVTLNILGPGQFFGWSSLFPPEHKMAVTRAVKSTRAMAIDANQLRSAWRADHGFEYAIVRRAGRDMAARIKAIRQQLANILAIAGGV